MNEVVVGQGKSALIHLLYEGHKANSFAALSHFEHACGRPGAMLAVHFKRFSSIAGPQRLWCAMFDILVASFVMLYLVPTADAYDRAHPHALRIFLLNIFLGWTVAGWVAALVWSRKISPVEFYAARNRPRRAVGMNAWWAAKLAVPGVEAGRELVRNAPPPETRTYGR